MAERRIQVRDCGEASQRFNPGEAIGHSAHGADGGKWE